MIYGSVCSGIEAATQAWQPLGWQAAFFSEIEKFPSAVLEHHYGSNMPGETPAGNGVPNYGDMTGFKEWPDHAIDILVGGTPCQSFSVAGLRKGLADPRGNLMLTFGAIAQRYKPKWIVWENVPGVLSSEGGRDFGTFLRLLGECGYGFAYRVLDAQFVRVDGFGRAVPQRRRRVFVVGYLGDWRRAAAVLFEPESVPGNPAPRRRSGEGLATSIAPSLRACGVGTERIGDTRGQDCLVPEVSPTILSGGNKTGGDRPPGTNVDTSNTLIPEVCGTISDGAHNGGGLNGQDAYTGRVIPAPLPIAFSSKDHGGDAAVDVSPTVRAGAQGGDVVAQPMAVRRLTPRECERLQGFPDDFTRIPWRNKAELDCPDGPRYRALGNSMAVNVIRWLGLRIEMIETLTEEMGI